MGLVSQSWTGRKSRNLLIGNRLTGRRMWCGPSLPWHLCGRPMVLIPWTRVNTILCYETQFTCDRSERSFSKNQLDFHCWTLTHFKAELRKLGMATHWLRYYLEALVFCQPVMIGYIVVWVELFKGLIQLLYPLLLSRWQVSWGRDHTLIFSDPSPCLPAFPTVTLYEERVT